jgi:hypothetical protein
MKRTLKVFLWCAILFVLSGFSVWLTPPMISQIDLAYSSLITAPSEEKTPAKPMIRPNTVEIPSRNESEPQAIQILEPAGLFLFGIGTIGFLGISRKRLFS